MQSGLDRILWNDRCPSSKCPLCRESSKKAGLITTIYRPLKPVLFDYNSITRMSIICFFAYMVCKQCFKLWQQLENH